MSVAVVAALINDPAPVTISSPARSVTLPVVEVTENVALSVTSLANVGPSLISPAVMRTSPVPDTFAPKVTKFDALSVTVPPAALTTPEVVRPPLLESEMSPLVVAVSPVTFNAPVFASAMPPVTVVPLIVLAAVSMMPAAPIPEAAVRDSMLAVRSAPASAPDSSIAPTELIVIVSPAAVTLSTSTLPLVTVVSVTFRTAPPAVTEVAVRLPPVAVSEIAPSVVVAEATLNPPVLSVTVIAPAAVALSVTLPTKSFAAPFSVIAPAAVTDVAPEMMTSFAPETPPAVAVMVSAPAVMAGSALIVALLVVRLVSGVTPPTVLAKLIFPATALSDSTCAPLAVPEIVMLPVLEVSVAGPVSVSASPKLCEPTLVMSAAMETVPPAFVVTLLGALTAPMTPPNVVAPLVLTARTPVPSIVVANVTAPAAELVNVEFIAVIASLYVCAPVVLVSTFANCVCPAASVVMDASWNPPSPIRELKRVIPEVFTVIDSSPSTTLRRKFDDAFPNVIAPPPVLVNVVEFEAASNRRLSRNLCKPVVVTLPPNSVVVPVAFVSMLVNAVVEPIAPVMVVAVVVLMTKTDAPSIVPSNVIAAFPVEPIVVVADGRLTAPT